jgi:hypothetical protein
MYRAADAPPKTVRQSRVEQSFSKRIADGLLGNI